MEELLNNRMDLNLENNLILEKQNNFFETNIGKAINGGINIGLRLLLPDFLENQIIEIKDILMSQGIKDGIKTITNSIMDLGKSVTGIFTGKFENITQIENAIKNGGVLDLTSKVLDKSIDLAKQNKLINNSTAIVLKKGQKVLLKSINNNMENMLTSQMKSIEKLDKYISNWKSAYKEKNIEKMKKEYKKINTELNKVIPIEKTIKTARNIENIHNLILNNGNNFNLSETELDLAKKLV
ncbi:MAG: hypothetical protein IJ223_03880 [Clostridia bacterium]|nr:hypothetical protein [Clostridia bacterium]